MNNPAWPPVTESDLDLAMKNGILIESQKLDLKRELKGGDSGNKEIAKDIAAFSVHGGVVIIGVDEGKQDGSVPMSLTPVDLSGLSERIEQVGLTRVDPPVGVTTTRIPSAAGAGHGYLLVEMAVSPRAPHQADGRYYSRGDKTNIVLSDAEVMEWHAKTLAQRVDAIQEIRDALQHSARTNEPWVELLITATPLGAHDDILLPLSESSSWDADARDLVKAAAIGCHKPISPLVQTLRIARHDEGILVSTDQTPSSQKAGYRRADLIFDDSGKLTLKSGGINEHIQQSSPAQQGVNEPLILSHVELLVHVAGQVSKYGFNGSWRFSLAARGLAGGVSSILGLDILRSLSAPKHHRDTYDSTCTASLQEITNSPQAIVNELTSKLLRALGSAGEWAWLKQP